MKRVLVVARVFPPFQSVGHSIRAVKFIRYLPASGWLPSVLTIDDRHEYESDRKQGSDSLLAEIPEEVAIHRTASGEPSWAYLEKERQFGQRNWVTRVIVKVFGGARRWTYRNLLLPDRAILWLPFALRRGRKVIRAEGIDVIFATCPPYSATVVGACLKLLTGKRLILDFRDDWLCTPSYEMKPAIVRLINRWLERWVVKVADKVVLVTEWSRDAFVSRYPREPRAKFVFIPNGCDLSEFRAPLPKGRDRGTSQFTMLHAGTLKDWKPWSRSPAAVFQALQSIVQGEPRLASEMTLAFTGFLTEAQRELAKKLDLSGIITELGFLPRAEFIRYMHDCDLLVVINYEDWATLIPGKIYEYWAVGGPPIMLLSCPGAASSLVERHGLGFTLELWDAPGIRNVILNVYGRKRAGTPIRVNTAGIERYDRKALSAELGQLLWTVAGAQSSAGGIEGVPRARGWA